MSQMTTTAGISKTANLPTVTKAMVDNYWEKGWMLLPGLFAPEEAKSWDAECKRLLALDIISQDNLRTGFRKIDDQPMIERFDPVIDVSPLFNDVVNDARVLSPLEAIFRDAPVLFKDKLIFKLPGMSGYTMHQDQSYWQMCPADDILSVSIQIDGADADNGCLELFPGYHRTLLTTELRNYTPEEEQKVASETPGTKIVTKPGDVVVFHSQTPHRSGKNTAAYSRRSLYLTYTAARTGNLYAAHRDHYKTYTTKNMTPEEKARKFFK